MAVGLAAVLVAFFPAVTASVEEVMCSRLGRTSSCARRRWSARRTFSNRTGGVVGRARAVRGLSIVEEAKSGSMTADRRVMRREAVVEGGADEEEAAATACMPLMSLRRLERVSHDALDTVEVKEQLTGRWCRSRQRRRGRLQRR